MIGFSLEDKYLIKSLRENKKRVKCLLKIFPNKDWKRDALKVLVDTTGTVDQRPDSGRPRAVHTAVLSSTKLMICL